MLVAPPLSGRSWYLGAVAHRVNSPRRADRFRARILDLGNGDARKAVEEWTAQAGAPTVLLLDRVEEALPPAGREGASARRTQAALLLRACARAQDQGDRVLLAVTPATWAELLAVSDGPLEEPWCLPALTPERGLALAARHPGLEGAERVLEALGAGWLRNPFLLDLALETAARGRLGPAEVGAEAVRRALGSPYHYWQSVFLEGLSAEQRAVVRAVRSCKELSDETFPDLELLARCGLLTIDPSPHAAGSGCAIACPVLASHLPPPLVIHHVSDVHFGPHAARQVPGRARGDIQRQARTALGEPHNVADSYTTFVRERCALQRGPHLLIVSGDLAEVGSEAELREAAAWLAELREVLESSPHPDLADGDQRVLVVGGNHDVDWSAVVADNPGARHARFHQVFESFPHPHLEQDPTRRPLEVVEYRGGLSVVLLGSAEVGGAWQGDPDAKRRLGELYGRLTDARLPALTLAEYQEHLREFKALLDRGERADPSLVATRTIEKLRHHPFRSPVRIAVLHHPVSPVPEVPESRPYASLLNAGDLKDALFEQGVQMVLHGHQHLAFFARESWPRKPAAKELLVVSAPSLGSTQKDDRHGFVELRIFREGTDYYEAELRHFQRGGSGWAPEGAPIVNVLVDARLPRDEARDAQTPPRRDARLPTHPR